VLGGVRHGTVKLLTKKDDAKALPELLMRRKLD
jgi:hypothetical protein